MRNLATKFLKYRNTGIPVLRVRCDNAGENRSVEKEMNGRKWILGAEFEFTVRHTPQQNSFTEVAIATMANRGSAMMNRSNVPEKFRTQLF